MNIRQSQDGGESLAQIPIDHGPSYSIRDPSSPSTRPKYPFKIFALTIAINEYRNPDYSRLKGCLADAADIEDYLVRKLLVPPSYIRSLRNSDATRDRILREIDAFQTDPNIRYGDPILIFYAGHGGETREAPPGWDSKVQFLIPYDCETYDSGGRKVYGIPDFFIGERLREIAKQKGNNITVILDNCHSGSGLRSIPDPSFRTRSIRYRAGLPPEFATGYDPNAYSMPPPTQGTTSRIGGLGIAQASAYPNGLKWHSVLLAACASGELAGERGDRGLFTKALLQTMRSLESNIWNVTYKELFDKIPSLNHQNPQCEGDHENRFIFRGEVKRQSLAPPSLDQLRGPAMNVALLLYIPCDERMQPAIEGLHTFQATELPNRSSIFLESQKDLAHFSLSCSESKPCFEIRDHQMKRKYGMKSLPHTLPSHASASQFSKIFQGIASYDYCLRCSESTLNDMVSISFHKAVHDVSGYRIGVGDNLIVGGKGIDITQDGSYFEIHLQNRTTRNLYPTLFYFDNCDFSIKSLYQTPTIRSIAHRPDEPLKAGQSFVIGHGSADELRLIVGVREGHDMEIGYLKLFISGDYIDLSGIEQESPFRNSRGLKPYQGPPKIRLKSAVIPFVVRPSQLSRSRGIQSSAQMQRLHSPAGSSGAVFNFTNVGKQPSNNNRMDIDGLARNLQGLSMQGTNAMGGARGAGLDALPTVTSVMSNTGPTHIPMTFRETPRYPQPNPPFPVPQRQPNSTYPEPQFHQPLNPPFPVAHHYQPQHDYSYQPNMPSSSRQGFYPGPSQRYPDP